ncbi:MAG: hypothetical protein N2508_05230 [Anaerolineae bacterium]|nr:hypothetical protein [Anaerolineae bacterium]
MFWRKVGLAAALGLMAGAALGVAIGWWLWPVEYVNTAPDTLRRDYRDEYILMTATAYEVDGNLHRARERLRLLNPADPVAPLRDLAGRLAAAGGDPADVARLNHLLEKLSASSPLPTPNPLSEDG